MTAIPVAIRVSRQRWVQLTLGIVCMAMIANLQYGWTLFVNPIDAKYHWGRAAIQVAFSIFVLTETWLVPVEGWFVDRYGPKVVVLFGGVLVGVAWMLNSVASSLPMLYVAAAVGGIGRRGGLRDLHRQCSEMVFGSTRARGRLDRGRFRCGVGLNCHPDPGHDR
jgi:MFS transporter, OFA family, oxalate/formate antiporter